MGDCIFCKIISGEVSSNKVYEDDDVLAFLDVNPLTRGHTLVIPKKHYVDLFDIPSDEFAKVMQVVKKISIAQKKSLDGQGTNVLHASGGCAQQTVFHFHMHVVARWTDDDIKPFPRPAYKDSKPSLTADILSKTL